MANNILNSVSSKIALGDENQGINDDPAILKVYSGTDLVYENAHLPIDNNSIEHPWWEADTQYTASDAFGQLERYYNGHHDFANTPNAYTEGWGHFSPLYANSNYTSYIGRYYLYRFNTINPTGTKTGYTTDEHVDLGRNQLKYLH